MCRVRQQLRERRQRGRLRVLELGRGRRPSRALKTSSTSSWRDEVVKSSDGPALSGFLQRDVVVEQGPVLSSPFRDSWLAEVYVYAMLDSTSAVFFL